MCTWIVEQIVAYCLYEMILYFSETSHFPHNVEQNWKTMDVYDSCNGKGVRTRLVRLFSKKIECSSVKMTFPSTFFRQFVDRFWLGDSTSASVIRKLNLDTRREYTGNCCESGNCCNCLSYRRCLSTSWSAVSSSRHYQNIEASNFVLCSLNTWTIQYIGKYRLSKID